MNRALVLFAVFLGLSVTTRAQDAPLVRDVAEDLIAPTPGAVTISLAEAVKTALQQNFGMLTVADDVSPTRLRETVARAQFYPKLVPTYGESEFGRALDID